MNLRYNTKNLLSLPDCMNLCAHDPSCTTKPYSAFLSHTSDSATGTS